jgi:hypothetical protein
MDVSGQLHAPAALLPGKDSLYPVDRRLGVPQCRSGRGGEEKNSQPLLGFEPPTIQSVFQRDTAELSRLLLSVSHTMYNNLFNYIIELGFLTC